MHDETHHHKVKARDPDAVQYHPSKSVKLIISDEDEEPKTKERKTISTYGQLLHRPGPRALHEKPLPEGQSNCLAGKTFVFSGELESTPRDEAIDLILRNGGRVTSAVSGRTTYLVTGEQPGAKKVSVAFQKGVPEISEDDLIQMIENSRKLVK